MKYVLAGLGLLGLATIGACSYTVELPPEDSSAEQVSPAVTVPPGQAAAPAAMEGSMAAGHGMEGMPPGHGMQGMPPGHGMQGMPPGHGMGGMAMMPPKDATPPGRDIAIGTALKLVAPEDWIPKTPAISMIQNEFSVPAAEGDSADGRVTVMTAGGSIQENIDRWKGQFSQPDGSKAADKAKVEKLEVAGCEVNLVDVSGTYSDARGMFAPAVERPDYRMLAAIIVTPEGNYFIKFYGPEKTVGQQAAAFRAMIEKLGK